jgi:hypothetical protein
MADMGKQASRNAFISQHQPSDYHSSVGLWMLSAGWIPEDEGNNALNSLRQKSLGCGTTYHIVEGRRLF